MTFVSYYVTRVLCEAILLRMGLKSLKSMQRWILKLIATNRTKDSKIEVKMMKKI